jgi:uncharacterized protein (TIGR02453 family)
VASRRQTGLPRPKARWRSSYRIIKWAPDRSSGRSVPRLPPDAVLGCTAVLSDLLHHDGRRDTVRSMPAFRGFPVEALEFYEGLEADNSKAFWQAHRHVYQEAVLAPMTALLDDLAPEFGEPHIFRPYRDVRFSKDKSPYKTNIGASLASGGYVQLSARGLAAGAGMHEMASDQLVRYRAAVAEHRTGRELERIVADLQRKGIGLHVWDELKTVPKGYPADHPRLDLLRKKNVTAWKEWMPEAWLGTGEARKKVVGFLRACTPMNEWLSAQVGPTTAASPGRR